MLHHDESPERPQYTTTPSHFSLPHPFSSKNVQTPSLFSIFHQFWKSRTSLLCGGGGSGGVGGGSYYAAIFTCVSVQVMWQYKPWTPFLLKKTFTYLILIQGHFSTDSFFLTLYATNAFNGVFIQPTLISFTHSVYKMLFYQSIRLHEKSMASCIYVGNTGLKWVKAFIFLLINASRS